MGLFSFLGRGGGDCRRGTDVDVVVDDAWEKDQTESSPYKAQVAPPLVPRPPRAGRRPKLSDSDRHVFQYARNMTAHNVW